MDQHTSISLILVKLLIKLKGEKSFLFTMFLISEGPTIRPVTFPLKKIYIYLVVPDINCGMWDLAS